MRNIRFTASFRAPRTFRAVAAIALLVCAGAVAVQAQPIQIEIGTIMPKGVGQYYILAKLAEDWAKVSGGTVTMRIAPGGERLTESGIVQRMNARKYQAGVLSSMGLGDIDLEAAALQNMPLMFRDWEEVDYVREKISDRLVQRLREKGFELLFWADAGWVNFFSVDKAVTPDEFKRMKIFAWSGSAAQVELMKSQGFRPVELSTPDIYLAFTSRRIEVAPLPPSFAQGIQVPSVAPHVVDVNWAPIVGACIIRKDTWEKIPPELRVKLLALCEEAGREVRREGRKFHDDALATLRKGPKTHVYTLTPEQRVEWEKLAVAIRPRIRGALVPEPIFDEVSRLLVEYRASRPAAK